MFDSLWFWHHLKSLLKFSEVTLIMFKPSELHMTSDTFYPWAQFLC